MCMYLSAHTNPASYILFPFEQPLEVKLYICRLFMLLRIISIQPLHLMQTRYFYFLYIKCKDLFILLTYIN